MKRPFVLVLCLVACAGLPLYAGAQAGQDLLERGKLAFREERYDEAARLLEQAAEQHPDDPEIHFLLARLYTETPLQDSRKANRALDRALSLKPEEVQYLVARLQQLRTESWNFFSERIKEARRMELARKVLQLDPDNAIAHEELGTVYIRDFWRYRNAIMLPTLEFGQQGYARSDFETDLGGLSTTELDPAQLASLQEMADISPDEVFLADRFDLETLREMGVPVQDLSARAQRAYEEAIGHLQKALEHDPRRRSVYDHMMEIYTLKGEYEDALDMLQQMYVFFPEDPETWSYLGLTHYRLGNLDAAAKSFETAFRFMAPEEQEAYDRLDVLLSEEERARYAQEPVAYAARFWTSKDPRYLTPYNERKLEHYARLTHADLLYGVPELDLRGWDTQRGRILVRYGHPNADVVIVPNSMSGSVRRALSGTLRTPLFETDQGSGETGQEPDAEPLTPSAPVTNRSVGAELSQSTSFMFDQMNTFNIWVYDGFQFVFEDPFRNGEYRLYSPSASDISGGVQPWLNDYEIIAKETFRRVPERYDYEAPGRQIEMPYLVNAFKGADGKTDLYVHYGVPVTSFDPAADMIELTANVGTFLISDARDILVERRRTIYGLRTDQIVPFEETNLWVDTQQMDAPPGEHDLSVEFETASGATVGVQRRAVSVPDFSGGELALSDMLLAYSILETEDGAAIGGADVVRNGFSITPAPWSVFDNDKPIYLYFEVYNLARGEDGRTDYDVEVQLIPKEQKKGLGKVLGGLFGGGDRGVSLRFTQTGTQPDEGLYQILDGGQVQPGLYTLALHLRDNVARRTVDTQKDLYLE